MKLIDRACAGAIFLLAIVECWLVPRTYPGRLWIFGTGLGLLFTAMLNLLRIRNGYTVRGLRLSCVGANVMMLALVLVLLASIGSAKTKGNPQIPLIGALLAAETVFSLAKNP
ncbi:MAG: hypothetical protein WA628_06885 [Terriglobales bacterium]